MRGERGAGMGYRSAPGLPGLWAAGRGMIFSHCLGRGFFLGGGVCVVLCVATPLWGMRRSLPFWCLHCCPLMINAHKHKRARAQSRGDTHRYTSKGGEKKVSRIALASVPLFFDACTQTHTHTHSYFTISLSRSIMSGNLLYSVAFMMG